MEASSAMKITFEIEPAHACALKRFAEKVSRDTALSVLYPHLPRELRSEQVSQIIQGFAALDRGLVEARVASWPWVDTGEVGTLDD
jgi:hypothetical protein